MMDDIDTVSDWTLDGYATVEIVRLCLRHGQPEAIENFLCTSRTPPEVAAELTARGEAAAAQPAPAPQQSVTAELEAAISQRFGRQ